MTRPRVLIEEDFPVEALGVESRRENSTGQHPAPNRLHVWWARRPLTVSRAAVLGSLLPADTDPKWFLRVLGIKGDPVAARQRMLDARAKGERVPGDLYGYKRAFSCLPDNHDMDRVKSDLLRIWGTWDLSIMDPMAGGGSIPFEAERLGFKTLANDLNPVAHIVEIATLKYPRMFGQKLVPLIKHYAQNMYEKGKYNLANIFPSTSHGIDLDYIWAHTIKCASCGYEIPLSPNWWIRRDDEEHLAVRPVVKHNSNRPEFMLVDVNEEPDYNPDQGTVKRGVAVCLRCHDLTDGEEIKRQAQDGRMGYQLYAVVYTTGKGRSFRIPTTEDEAAVQKAEKLLAQKLPEWENKGWVPTEMIPDGNKTREALRNGYRRWMDLFAPRQLLSLLTYLEAFQEVKQEILSNHPFSEARAILTYLAFTIDKSADYNSRMTRFDGTRNKIANTFDRHDYAFKWSFAEMNLTAPGLGFDWAVDQVIDAYEGLCKLIGDKGNLQWFEQPVLEPTVRLGSATDLYDVADESIHAVVVDPPYYDNVMYAEMADFFYVWQKRTLGDLYPEVFLGDLTDKNAEAVANVALFRSGGTIKPKIQAEKNYQNKMKEVFQEVYRILKPDGVLTIMFTHKRVEAWDTLASALIHAGFEITASWPVHTESEHSMHIANKNAAESTILLVCRKREASRGGWWDELLPIVRERVLERAQVFERKGFRKLDLMLATYGPALQVLSEHWPVKDSTGQLVQPERVLEEARSLVTQLRVTELVQHRQVVFDPITRWYVLAWDVFGAEKFPYDEARLLALTCGVDLDRQVIKEHGVAVKSNKYVVLQTPAQRMEGHRWGNPENASLSLLDGLHLALTLYQRDGGIAASQYLQRHHLDTDVQFQALVDACLLAIPRVRSEWKILQALAVAQFRQTSHVLEQMTLEQLPTLSEDH
ncbi:DUF1156 domain-containing protein [Sulfobacillus thermosulfidooxidans]|uniref:DUF1156 domain-containing protein n=1 Tax=Sulfobacillus thermosulfidooxidans TaxID=28034 RepID=UPI000416CCF8|nr:DUF1156 domain-containing protein [Sulfobacillus thermosulfidooxidans]